jgi:hypothetical protein
MIATVSTVAAVVTARTAPVRAIETTWANIAVDRTAIAEPVRHEASAATVGYVLDDSLPR